MFGVKISILVLVVSPLLGITFTLSVIDSSGGDVNIYLFFVMNIHFLFTYVALYFFFEEDIFESA